MMIHNTIFTLPITIITVIEYMACDAHADINSPFKVN